MEEKTFPKRIVLEDECDQIRHDLRVTVQRVQSAYLALKNDPDFTLPSSFDALTADYSREYYRPFMEAISKDFTLDEDQRRKLKNRWGRIQADTTHKVNIVCDGIKSTNLLNWKFDEAMQMPVPTASIDEVAEKMATHDVPSLACEHWQLVQVISSAIRDLREWERSNNIRKQPLQNLVSWDERQFARQWVRGLAINPDEEERVKVLREAHEKHIF